MLGFQAEGAAPLVHGKPVANPETVASAIRIGNPARWEEAMDGDDRLARRASRAVSDAQILDAYRFLAAARGRVLRAGLGRQRRRAARRTAPTGAERVVCVLTGHGLKDPQTALAHAGVGRAVRAGHRRVEQAVLG